MEHNKEQYCRNTEILCAKVFVLLNGLKYIVKKKKDPQAIPLDILVSEYLLHLTTLFFQSTSRIKENFTPSTEEFS